MSKEHHSIQPPERGTCPVAVIGMACRFQGANTKEDFWDMMIRGGYNYSELPPDRLDQELYFSPEKGVFGKSYSNVGSCLELPKAEREFPEAISGDPGHHLACDVAMEACRDAGFSPDDFPYKNSGVFMGCTRGSLTGGNHFFLKGLPAVLDYLRGVESFSALDPALKDELIREVQNSLEIKHSQARRIPFHRLYTQLAAWNIARTLNLSGPALITDAACSSSLAALGMACRALSLGKIDAALLGGNSFFAHDSLILFSKAQSISADISCPFDERASGLICGEAQVFFVLKTLEKAEADGDRIYGVLRGIGSSTDGKGKALWAPRKEGQCEAILRAFQAGADPERLRYVEMHATSTPLGDPTEVAALAEAVKQLFPEGHRLDIGSVKANVGHTMEAAGTVGLLKLLLMLKHKIIPPQIHFRNPNTAIQWSEIPLDVVAEAKTLEPVAPGQPIQLAVNAFGIGGINFHVLVEEYLGKDVPAKRSPSRTGTTPADGAKDAISAPQSVSVTTPANAPPGPVAVLGFGVVLPQAHNIEQFRKRLWSGEDAKTEFPVSQRDRLFVPDGPGRSPALRGRKLVGGFIENWEFNWRKHRIAPLQIAKANPLQFMILDAVDQALGDAGYAEKDFDRKRTGIVVGTRFAGGFDNSLQMGIQFPEIRRALERTLKEHGVGRAEIEKILDDYQTRYFENLPAINDETGSFTSSSLASRVTKAFDLMGGAASIDSGRVGAFVALEAAIDMLHTGQCEMMICAGAERNAGYITFENWAEQGRLASLDKDPLDDEADGVFPGEGVAVVVLKSLDKTLRDGDRIRGIIHGIGSGASRRPGEAVDEALRRSETRSGIAFGQIDLLEIASVEPTREEKSLPLCRFASLRNRAQKSDQKSKRVVPAALGSLAGQFGDLGEAAGIAALIKALLSMEELAVPGVRGLRHLPDSVDAAAYRYSEKTSPLEHRNPDGRVFTSVFCAEKSGDFTVASNLVLQRGTRVPLPETPSKTEPETVSETSRQSVAATAPALWAMLFPGQGAQYPGMIRAVAEVSSPCREILAELDETLRKIGRPTFAEMAWNEPTRLGKDILHTQLSLLVCDTVYARMLASVGVKTVLHIGHSYGEYPALVEAGAWDFETAALATVQRCKAIESIDGSGSGMLSTNAEPELLRRCIDAIDAGRLYVSNRNTPDQTVVSGETDALKLLAESLKKNRCAALILPVPAGFHSPLVGSVREPLRNALLSLDIGFPKKTFLSGVTGCFEAEPSALRESLVEQMVRPVDFIALLEKAREFGVRRFVEAGPKTTLSNMGRKILAGDDVRFFSCDRPRATGEEILAGLEAIATEFRNDIELAAKSHAAGTNPVRIDTATDQETVEHVETKIDPAVTVTELPPSANFRTDLSLPADVLCVEISGTPYEIGLHLGTSLKNEIRRVLRRYADKAGQPASQLPDVTNDLHRIDRLFTPESLEELRGIAEGAAVPLPSLVRHNLSAYPDSVGAVMREHLAVPLVSTGMACTYFAGRTTQGRFLQGTNIDVPIYRMLSGTHIGLIQIRRPAGKKAHVLISGSGFVGGILGINADGLAITGASLSDFPRTPSSSEGIIPALLIEKVLAESSNLDQAVAILRATPRSAAWSLCITELATGRMNQVEYCGSRILVRDDIAFATATNHQQFLGGILPKPLPEPPSHSVARLNRLHELLPVENGRFSVSDPGEAFRILRDKKDILRNTVPKHRTINTIWRIDNTLSVLIDPAEKTVHLASTDMEATDSDDPPCRHATVSLYDLLPELEPVLGDAKAREERSPRRDGVPVVEKDVRDLAISRDEYCRLNTSKAGHEPVPVPMRFNRYVLRLIETPLPENSARKLQGGVLICAEDENPFAQLLAEKLSRLGMRFFNISPELPVESLAETLDGFEKNAPLRHLLFLGATDPGVSPAWSGRTTVFPIFLLKEWVRLAKLRGDLGDCTITAPLRLGGHFGLGSIFATDTNDAISGSPSGALSGILKGIRMELETFETAPRIKLIDQDITAPSFHAAEEVLAEFLSVDAEREVAYRNGKRFVLRAVVDPLPENAAERNSKAPRTPETWLVTGGARGITAAIALELGRRRGAKLILLGSSPRPKLDPAWKNYNEEQLRELRKQIFKDAAARKEVPIRAWERVEKAIEIDRNLEALDRAGIVSEYHACDLVDRAATGEFLARMTERHGRLTGIVHGAGFEKAARISKKTVEDVKKTFDVKVGSALTLLEELRDRDMLPRVFLGFSSVSGRFGGVGQIDYCGANEMLAKTLDVFDAENADCRCLSLHWPAWGEVGMAARPESKLALEASGLEFMPPREGVAHALDEIARILDDGGTNEREILVCDWKYYKRCYPDGTSVPAAPEESPRVATPDTRSKKAIPGITLFLSGNNADTDRIFEIANDNGTAVHVCSGEWTKGLQSESVRKSFAANEIPVLLLGDSRDPLGGALRSERHWKYRLETTASQGARNCREYLAAAGEFEGVTPRILLLVSLGGDDARENAATIPEGAILLDCVRRWSADTKCDVTVLDLPVDCPPKDAAALAWETLSEVPVAGRRVLRYAATGRSIPLDEFSATKIPFGTRVQAVEILEDASATPRDAAKARTPLLLEDVRNVNGTDIVGQGRLDPVDDTFLHEHRIGGRPILPLVAALEAYAETLVTAVDKGFLPQGTTLAGFDNFEVRSAMTMRTDRVHRFRIDFKRDSGDAGLYHGAFQGDLYNAAGRLVKENMVFSQADCRLTIPGENEPRGTVRNDESKCVAKFVPDLEFQADPSRWLDNWYPEEGQIPIYHGKPFRKLGRMNYVGNMDRSIAELFVPEPSELFAKRSGADVTGARPLLFAAVIDAVFFGCGVLHWMSHKGVCIPLGFESFRFRNGTLRPGETAYAHIAITDSGEENTRPGPQRIAVFDFTIRNSSGEAVYDVKGYKAVTLKQA